MKYTLRCPRCGSFYTRTPSGCVCPESALGKCSNLRLQAPVPYRVLRKAIWLSYVDDLPTAEYLGRGQWKVFGTTCRRKPRLKVGQWDPMAAKNKSGIPFIFEKEKSG